LELATRATHSVTPFARHLSRRGQHLQRRLAAVREADDTLALATELAEQVPCSWLASVVG